MKRERKRGEQGRAQRRARKNKESREMVEGRKGEGKGKGGRCDVNAIATRRGHIL